VEEATNLLANNNLTASPKLASRTVKEVSATSHAGTRHSVRETSRIMQLVMRDGERDDWCRGGGGAGLMYSSTTLNLHRNPRTRDTESGCGRRIKRDGMRERRKGCA
jgi:hypothetical protein